MNTQIKLILRALLPLLFIGANRIGQHIARPHFIPNGAAVRVEVLFPHFCSSSSLSSCSYTDVSAI